MHFQVHRLVIVDTEDKVIGILSLSDILHYLVLRPSGMFNLLFFIIDFVL